MATPACKFDYCPLPDGWATTTETFIGSRSATSWVRYNTPLYKGVIRWEDGNCFDVCHTFDWEGKKLVCSSGHDLKDLLNIPDQYCQLNGKDGWEKILGRTGFEQWLKDTTGQRGERTPIGGNLGPAFEALIARQSAA
jgi:hypothetical protein